MIGKSTGIALLMAAALLAALFAMGVFSATGVKAQTATTPGTLATLAIAHSAEPIDGAAAFETTPADVNLTTVADGTAYTAALLAGTPNTDPPVAAIVDWKGEIPKGSRTLVITPTLTATTGTELEVQWNDQTATFASSEDADTRHADQTSVAIDLVAGVTGEIKIVVTDSDSTDNNVAATNFASHTYTISLDYDYAANSMVAGKGVRLNLSGTLVAGTGDVISIKAAKFGLPSSIDPNHVTLQNDGNQAKATDVDVSGDVIDVTIPDMNGDTTGLIGLVGTAPTMITIATRAGVTNPKVAGLYAITLNDSDATGGDDPVDALNAVKVVRTVTVDPKKGSSKADVTVKGTGFSTGSATVFIDKTEGAAEDDAATTDVNETEDTYDADMMYKSGVDKVISSGAAITDGSFTVTVAGIAKPAGVDAVTISAFDGASNLADTTATYTFSAGISADPEMISWGQVLTLNITDYAGTPTEVRFGGNNDYKNDVEEGATAKVVKVKVPAGVPVGKQRVEILDSTGVVAGLSTTVEIVPLSLNISPSSPVPGQQVTISGSGYDGSVQISGVTFGSLDKIAITDTSKTSTSAGSVSFTYKVPLNVGTGSKMVSLNVGERTGQGTITVPKPSISISPTESLIGSDVTITGTGFASSSRVEVFYSEVIEAVGTSDSNGNVSIRLTVPSAAGIGKTNTVEVRDRTEATIKATASHKTPGAMLTVPERAQSGSTITISGSNFQGFSTLSEVMIGGQDAKPAPAPETDRQGTFSIQVRVPRLAVGSQTISVKDGNGNSATETFSIVDTPVSRAPADVFAELGDRLSRVWYLDRMTQEWSFYDPAPEFAAFNSLTEVISGEVYQIIITEGDPVEFQGKTLYKGTNPISLR